MNNENIVKQVCKELELTEKEMQNMLAVIKELPPLFRSLKIVEFELRYAKIDSPLYQAIKAAKEEVEKVIRTNQCKAVATLLAGENSGVEAHLCDKSSRR